VQDAKKIEKGYDSAQVGDINFEGIFKTTRNAGNPLNPVYNYDPETNASWHIDKSQPKEFRQLSDNPSISLRTKDILGCEHDSLSKPARSIVTREVLRTDDVERAQANTVEKCMRTNRCSNPLDPMYQPLASKPGTPVKEWQHQTAKHQTQHRAAATIAPTNPTPPTPNTLAKQNKKRLARVQQEVRDKVTQRTTNIRQTFLKFDANHDGTVNHQEFRQGLTDGLGCHLATPDVDMLIKHVDADGSGRIDYFEFADQMKARDIETYQKDDKQDEQGREHRNQAGHGSFALEQAGGIWRTKTPEPLQPGQELTEDQRIDRDLDVKLKRAIENKSQEMLKQFRKFDEDQNSMLTPSELRRGLDSLQVNFDDKEFDRLIQRLDGDNTGYVDYGEFARYMQDAELQNRGHHASTGLGGIAGGQMAAERQEHAAMKAVAERGPNKILTAEELEDKNLNDMIWEKARGKAKTLNRLFAQFDDNSDGTVSYAEFRRGIERGLNIPVTDQQMSRLVGKIDKDSSGHVDYLEFADKMKPKEYTGAADMEADQIRTKAQQNVPSTGRRSGRSSAGSTARLTSGERLRRAREREDTKSEIDSVRSLPDNIMDD